MSYYNFRLISSFFFPLKETRNVSIVEGEATPTRSVPLPMVEEEEEEEGEEGEAEEEEAGGGDVVAMATTSL